MSDQICCEGGLHLLVPKTLNDWTLESIKALVRSGYQESESFDFKSQLPDRRAKDQKSGLKEDCCAFANSNGGFLVFGVKDAQAATGEDRIVGMDTADFLSNFGDYPSQCQPGVTDWRPREPPIKLDNGKLIQVIYIPQSFRGPHAVQTDNRWVFKKRTNKGNEDMSYNEIRLSFLHQQERLRRVYLLITELGELAYEATEHHKNWMNPARFDLSVLDALWSDIYPIVDRSAEVTESITRLRRLCRTVNRNAEIIDRWSFRGGAADLHLNPPQESNRISLTEIAEIAANTVEAVRSLFP